MSVSLKEFTSDFGYIAFDHSSGKTMAHGRRAIDALDRADRIGPAIEIEILAAGLAGMWIWENSIPLIEARSALDKMYMNMDAFAATSYSVVLTDPTLPDNPIVYVNAAFSALYGYADTEVIGRNCRLLQGPDSDPLVCADIRAALADGRSIRREILNYRKDGTPFWNDLMIDPIRDPAGRLMGYVGIQNQVDAARRATEEKAAAQSKLAIIADHVPGYIYQRVMRTNGLIEVVYCSPSICKILGIEESDVSRTFFDHVHPEDLDGLTIAIRSSAANMSIFREEFRLVSSTGATHWLRSEAPPRRMAKGEIVWDGLAIEISAEKRWQSEIANQALRDVLTGLLTRVACRQALTMQLNAESGKLCRCGVLCIDINKFRELNDSLGQDLADKILCETAQRLTRIAESVAGVAARLRGDQFAILVPACASKEALSLLAQSANEALILPITIDAHNITIQTCIGAALYDNDEAGTPATDKLASELIMKAELALGWAKQEGPNAHVLYSLEFEDHFQDSAIFTRTLEQAIADDELELHYQPLVDLASGRIVSAEALVRWNHPSRGTQRPDLFIPLAESSGLIVPLGRWVLAQAFRQHVQWRDEGLAPPPIAINISGIQLLDPSFIAIIKEMLGSTGAKASNFEIELTERVLIEPSPQVMATLHDLRTMGFAITIDDFGSGHASFRYLRDFPVDKLKIDQVFIRNLVSGSPDALIIRAVVGLAQSLGIEFVAEGLETEMHRDFLEREGCKVGQGYFFSSPIAAKDFAWMLVNNVKLPLRA